MTDFICPVCKMPLTEGAIFTCENGHCFDASKHGYVNLLQSQKSSAKRHGDDKLMVSARQSFLDKGYYSPLLAEILGLCDKYLPENPHILDAGCGECWYTAHIAEHLAAAHKAFTLSGVDISKNALAAGAKRCKALHLAVAGVFDMPLPSSSCHMLINLFAPLAASEFARILKPSGIFLRAIPLEKHLMGLKTAIYDTPYENKLDGFDINGFELIERRELRQVLRLESGEDIQNLFSMTPYYYKTSAADQAKVAALKSLETQLEFGVLVYRKS